jgi:hypothetical protein
MLEEEKLRKNGKWLYKKKSNYNNVPLIRYFIATSFQEAR